MRLLLLLILLLSASVVSAQGVFQSARDGDWSDDNTWTLLSGTDGDDIPDADDNVTIRAGHTVEINNGVNSACNNLTLAGTGEVDFSQNNRTLTVNGTMTMTGNSRVLAGNGTRLLNLLGPFIIPTGQIGRIDNVDITQATTQNFTILGELISTSATNTKSIGNVLINSGGTSTGKWTFQATETWSIQSLTVYDGPAGEGLVDGTSTGTLAVAGNFSVIGTTSGQKSKFGRVNLTVSGTTSIAGYMVFTNSATGAKRFNNTITVTNSGTWDNEIGEDPFINCSIVNNGNWPESTGGSAYYTVETAGTYTYAGSNIINMGRLVVNAGTVTNQTQLNLIGDTDQGLQANAAAFVNGNGGYLTLPCTGNAITLAGGATVNFTAVSNTVEYNLAGAQNVFPTTYYKLICSNSGTKTQSTGTVAVANELNLTGTGTIYNAGTNTLNGAANLVMTGTSELRLAKNAVNLPELTGTSNSLASGTTVNLSGNGAQTLKASSTYAYQNVSVSGGAGSAANFSNVTMILGNVSVTNSGAVTSIPAGGLTVVGIYNTNSTGTTTMTAGNLTVGSIVLDGTAFNYTGRTITINGNNGAWTNNGITTLTTNASSNVIFTTGTGQQLGGTTATTFPNLTVNNSNGVTLNSVNPTVSGTLTLTAGALITDTQRVIASATVTRTSGFVQGNLQKPVANGNPTTVTYEIGTGTSYSPVVLAFNNTTTPGNFMASSTAGDHPDILNANIEPSLSVNRYYSLERASGLVFTSLTATLNFVVGDIDPMYSPATDGFIKRYNGTAWTSTVTGALSGTSAQFLTSLYANFPLNTSRDFQIGKRIFVSGFFNRLTGTQNWHTAATWINNRTGTITLTNGQTAVVGAGTSFLTELAVGDRLVFQNNPGMTFVEVNAITDNTHLTLLAAYGGTTASAGYGRLRIPNTSADSVVVGNSNLTDATTTIQLAANATIHTLVLNTATGGRATSHNVTHTGTSILTARNVVVNQPAGAATDSWNINAGSAVLTGDLTIASANTTTTRIASVNVTSGALTIGGDLFFNANGTGTAVTSILDVGTGRVNLAGLITFASERGTLNMGATGVFNFNGTTASQIIDWPTTAGTFIYTNIECNNTSTNGVQLALDLTNARLTGNLRVLTGKFQLPAAAAPAVTGNGGTTILEVANGATLEMLGTQNFPTGFNTYTLGSTSTVIFAQTGNTTLPATPASYGNLSFLEDPNFTMPNTTITVTGNLTVGNGTVNPDLRGTTATALNVTGNISIAANASITATAIGTITLQGNWVNDGTFTPGAGTTSVVFGGAGASQPQTIGGTTADTFYRLTLNTNDDADLVRLLKNISVSNRLTLTRGGLEPNGNQLSITSTATAAITRASPGYIKSETTGSPYSRVRWTINAATGSYVYPFGKTSAVADYIPFTLNVTAAGATNGTFEVSTYSTATNNTPYPFGVTNVNSGLDGSGGQVADRFWILTPAGFTSTPTSTLTFTTTASEVAGIAGSLRAQRWTTGDVWEAPLPGQSSTATSVTVPGVTTFSPWAVTSSLSLLPIELLSFEARPIGGIVQLEWETASEINNEYFDVERSRDGEAFVSIGRISGAGNSHKLHTYKFTDTNPFSGKSYYRLRQTDYDGIKSYSWVQRIETTASFTILAWPNPSDGSGLNVTWRDGASGDIVAIRLWTQSGAIAFEGEVALDEELNSNFTFTEKLSPGLYILEATTTVGAQRLKLIVK